MFEHVASLQVASMRATYAEAVLALEQQLATAMATQGSSTAAGQAEVGGPYLGVALT